MDSKPHVARAPDPASGTGNDLFGARVPMVQALGLIGEELRLDYARVRLPFNPAFTNSRHQVHGGAMLAVLDCLLACAARSHDPIGTAVMTVDLSTHFIASASGDLIGEARCLRRGNALAFSQGEIRDSGGKLLATATGTMKLIARRAQARED